MKKRLFNFTITELIVWGASVFAILFSFFLFDRENYLTLIASLVGVTSLIFCAKGKAIGQVLMILFSILYAVISYSFRYFGEMLTYLCMTMPMSIVSLVSWIKHPFEGEEREVKTGSVGKRECVFMWIAVVLSAVVFYFPLRYFHTSNILPSTLSVATSFLAVYLTFRRSPYFALAYAANDVVLIVLWVLASVQDARYLSVVLCFVAFLGNDIYCFIRWKKRRKAQKEAEGQKINGTGE